MDARPVRVGVIGAGLWANEVHLAAFRAHPNATVTGICDVDPRLAEKAARRFGVDFVTTDADELISRNDVDALDIVTPNNMHASLVLAAIEAGKHVMCEKPMAMNVAEAQSMADAADRAGVKAGINFTWRNSAAARYAREIVQRGQLGRLYHVNGCYLSSFGRHANIPLIWRLRKDMAGTGALGDTGSHIIDLVEWISGDRIVSLVADLHTFTTERPLRAGGGVGHVDVDDAASMLVRFAGGAMGTVSTTFYGTGVGMDQRIELYGEKGTLILSWQDRHTVQASLGQFADENQLLTVPIPSRFLVSDDQVKQRNVLNFVDAIVNDTAMCPDFHDGLRNQRILDAATASATKHGWVDVG